jgi:hypothetical protein
VNENGRAACPTGMGNTIDYPDCSAFEPIASSAAWSGQADQQQRGRAAANLDVAGQVLDAVGFGLDAPDAVSCCALLRVRAAVAPFFRTTQI